MTNLSVPWTQQFPRQRGQRVVGSVMTVEDDAAKACRRFAEGPRRGAVLKVLPGWLPLPRNWQKMAAPKTP